MTNPYTKEAVVEHMVDWFLHNFEHPAESTPVDDGEYVYIWGEPVDEGEELLERFGGVIAPELIEIATKKLIDDHDVCDWVPVPQPDDEEDEAPDTASVIAECEHCGGKWRLFAIELDQVKLLEGACANCMKDSDTEKPLTFRLATPADVNLMEPLPLNWLAGWGEP